MSDNGKADGSGRLHFGEFELDPRSGKLFRDGWPVKIQPQPLRVLSVLLDHPGKVVSREDLRSRIWDQATFVEFDQGLNYCIRQIRLALRDDASEPVYIETLPKQGYRFIAPVTYETNGHALAAVPSVPELDAALLAQVKEFPPAAIDPPAHRSYWKTPNFGVRAGMALAVLAAVGVGFVTMRRPSPDAKPATYSQITSFTDAAVAPALSPDGRMVAFYRSDRFFFIPGEIYAKMLPNGEPVQLTHDSRLKYNLAFSPDGSRIAYTVFGPQGAWSTYTVPALGGASQLLLSNAAGLTWLDQHQLLFSEIKTGEHLGIVTASEDRSGHREIYFPARERAMAHYSYASPDRKWALVAEMDPQWQACRLIPLDGSQSGRKVGPAGACTSAGWSPDGEWMYFGANVGGESHLWRQHFPDGQPERITSGSTEEDGLAVAPDGRSLITSIFTKQDAVWVHDARGDYALSTQGYAEKAPLSFSPDGKRLYYLLRRDSLESPAELWRADLASRNNEALVPGVSMREYDISPDEKEVLFTTQTPGQPTRLWLAPLDRSAPPRMVSAAGDASPRFGPDGQILFRLSEGKDNYLARMHRDGSGRAKVFEWPILDLIRISPDRRLVVVGLPLRDAKAPKIGGKTVVMPLDGSAVSQDFCAESCLGPRWSPDGRYFYVGIKRPSRSNPTGTTLAIPLPPGKQLPPLIALRVNPPGAKSIQQFDAYPGVDFSYAYVKPTMHANLFRIPLAQ